MIKNIRNLIIFSILTLFLAPKIVFAEEIKSFNQDIKIEKNSDIIVEETIVYDFTGTTEQRHGIYRYIPYKYDTDKGIVKIDIKILSIKDENDVSYKYKTGRENSNFYLKIGDPGSYVTGIKTYKIKYRFAEVIKFFKDHDEFYWNITGNGWQVPINSASATVTLPSNISRENWKLACYTGVYGSKESLCSSEILSDNKVSFKTQEVLKSYEGLTIVVGLPKNIIKEPTALQRFFRFLFSNFLIFVPIITFFLMLFLWIKKGRDPQQRGAIIAEYEPPEGMTPAQAQAIIKESVDIKGITATIIDLARKGYFTIKEIEKETIGVFKSKDWELSRTGKSLDNKDLEDYEKVFINDLFGGRNNIKISELKERTTLPEKIKNFEDKIMTRTTEKKYFPEKPGVVVGKYILKGTLLLLFLGGITILLKHGTFLNYLSLGISFGILIIFSYKMPCLSKEGKEVENKLLGFKEFLSVTEKDRVKFHFSPEAHPEKFSQYLPYAIIFGVEREWAGVFKGIDIPPPNWYQGAWVGGYTAFAMADSISSFNSNFSSSVKGASAASGGSGLGGGGFSGGGAGGGGGGSW